MKKIFLSSISIILFIGCCTRGPGQYPIKVTDETYTILEINPPKHFYVTLKRNSDGFIFEHVYISKHCNNYRNISVGQQIQAKRYSYLDDGRITENFESSELRETLCN